MLSWWTISTILALVGGTAAVGSLAVAFAVVVKHRLRRQTAQIRRHRETEILLDVQYRDLFDMAGDAVWVTDAMGKIVALNRAGEKLLGVTQEQAAGRTIVDYLDPTDAAKARASQIARAFAPFEIVLRPASGGPVVAEVSSRALPDGGVQTIARNVTERRKLQDQVERVRRLDAIGRLAGGIAHDFNNLLTVINGNAELLKARLPPGSTAEMADAILAAGERAARLTRQLLSFCRQRFSAPAAIDLSGAIAGLVPILRSLVGNQVEIVPVLRPHLPPVLADLGLIEQIVLNLVVNGRDAMPAGGTITLSTEAAEGGWGRLAVADTGCGMNTETQARLFEPFFTTKSASQGTGLGLATVYGIVQGLGGRITFTTSPGRGTVFLVDFPSAPMDLVQTDLPTPRPAIPTLDEVRGATILLVEDDDAVRLLATQILRTAGFQLLVASSGAEALELYRAAERPIDLLLTDVLMPGMTGRQLVDQLRAEGADLPVLYFSGYPGDELSRQGLAEGTIDLLRKPFTPSELRGRVSDMLKKDILDPAR